MATDETILTLGNIAIPTGSGRGITQTLSPIDNGNLRRTVNGTLKDLTRLQNRKFESSVQCTDMGSPAIAELWKGQIILVGCIQVINQNIDPASLTVTLIRDPIAGSIFGFEADGTKQIPTIVAGRDITFGVSIIHVEFRPELSMMVVSNSMNTDEYAAEEGWDLDFEEV